jgi:hypothetical protein
MIRVESPYGIIGMLGDTPELRSGDTFLEDYTLAFNLAHSLEVTEPAETASTIKQEVSETLGPDTSALRVLAVSSLAAAARDRALRRPLARAQRELRQDDRKIFDIHVIKAIKTRRGLLKEQLNIYKQQSECSKAQSQFLDEAVELRDFIRPIIVSK